VKDLFLVYGVGDVCQVVYDFCGGFLVAVALDVDYQGDYDVDV
jgi:hypothetical protein